MDPVWALLGSNGTMEATRGYLLRDTQREKTLGSTDAGLSSPDVQTEEHRRAAAVLPEGAINAQGRFSLSPASPEIIAELERLLKAATRHAGTSTPNLRTHRRQFPPIWRQLKPGSLILAAGFDEENLDDWWEAIIVRVDDDGFLVRWRERRDPAAQGYCNRTGWLIPRLSCDGWGDSGWQRKSSVRSIGVTRIAIRTI